MKATSNDCRRMWHIRFSLVLVLYSSSRADDELDIDELRATLSLGDLDIDNDKLEAILNTTIPERPDMTLYEIAVEVTTPSAQRASSRRTKANRQARKCLW